MPTLLEFLTPVLVLVTWTSVMWIWMYATRLPAMTKAGIDPQEAAHPGAVAHRIPSTVRRVADNYNHLHEQPTLFYALALAAQVANTVDGISVSLAWTYVSLRVIHSFVQATRNVILVRFYVFAAASLVLLLLLLRTILLLV
jgi:hypothetical protein